MTSRNFEPKVNWWLMGVEMQSDHLFKTLCFLPDFCTSRTKLMSSVHTRIFKALFYIRFYLFSKKKSRRNYFRKRKLTFWDQILFWSNFFFRNMRSFKMKDQNFTSWSLRQAGLYGKIAQKFEYFSKKLYLFFCKS